MANLRIPGPTPVPEDILATMSKPMINHRGPEYRELIARVTQGIQHVFQTKYDVLIFTTSGTGALEASIVNTLSPGDQVLNVSIGVFGDRFGQIAETYGATVKKLNFEWGTAADPEQIRQTLRDNPNIKAVSVTHNETSTGVTNDIESIASVVKKEFNKLLLVDGVSSVSSIPCLTDDWELDVTASGSQKGWMVPPGLAFVAVSPRAWEAAQEAKMPRFYFDFGKAKSYLDRGENPLTPVLSVMFAMDLALEKISAEGLTNVFARHARLAQFTRDGVKNLGLELFADERYASDTVTSIRLPEGLDGSKLSQILRTEHDVVVGGGQASLAGKIIRIGHMGYVSEEDLQNTLDALRIALTTLGFTPATIGRS